MLRSIHIRLDIAAKRLPFACTTLPLFKNDLETFKSRITNTVEQLAIDIVLWKE